MATNLQLDDGLIEEAMALGGHRTKRDAVTHAIEEYVRGLQQERITEMFGAVDFDPDYDYKAQRAAS